MRKTDLPLYVEDPNCHMFKKQKSELRTNAIKWEKNEKREKVEVLLS